MKALFLTREYPPYIYGGAGVHVDYLSRELAKIIDVEVRCYGDQDVSEGPIPVKGHAYKHPMFDGAPELLKGALQALRSCVSFSADPMEADVVHCHTWYAHFGGILAKIGYGLPLVITTHSLEPLRPWKREQLGRGYDLSSWIEKNALEMADLVIAVSQETKADVLRLFDIPEERIEVVYNGIDLDEYRPVESTETLEKYGVDPKLPYVLFVGRIARQKGIIHLVNAIKYLPEGLQVVLCAGMPDTEEIEREMEAGVEEARKGREGKVIWIPEMLSRKQTIEMYTHADVFCCPSIYEPFGIINLEAMACRTPVVASAVGGIKEVVVNGETGFLVPLEQYAAAPFEPKDPDRFARDLAASVAKLIENPELADKMGRAGRERTEKLFSWKAIAARVAELYRGLL